MKDYWNDPPEPPDIPECCGDEMTIEDSGAAVCERCGKRIAPTPDVDPPNDPTEEDVAEAFDPGEGICPHNLPVESCPACDAAGDIAFDATRERRFFGR